MLQHLGKPRIVAPVGFDHDRVARLPRRRKSSTGSPLAGADFSSPNLSLARMVGRSNVRLRALNLRLLDPGPPEAFQALIAFAV